jgi:glyoxylase-like metal-dependent hydrolase (beta-lactamase superfamily II)
VIDRFHGCSRRQFLTGISTAVGSHALRQSLPVSPWSRQIGHTAGVAPAPLIDYGFAAAAKIGNGVFATISDPLKGAQTTCNGGFLVGKDAAFLIEGFNSPAGASFQFDAMRMVSKVPVKAALDTHFHYDHSMGNSFYVKNGVPLWAHAETAKRIKETYGPMQKAPKEAALGPYEDRVKAAKSELEKSHAQSDLTAMEEIFASANASALGLPDHALDPATLPYSFDLGGLIAVLEYYPGHSGTDIVVRVPDQNIVFTGDLLFQGKYPVCFDPKATISGWRATLKKFAAFDPDTLFVPGHGRICGQDGIASIRDVFDDIVGQAEKMYKAGVPIERAQHLYVVPPQFKDLAIWSWGFVIGSAITELYAEWAAPHASAQASM